MRRGFPPSWSATTSPYSPPSSLNHAILCPSGDHTAWRSATPGLRVILRQLPSSTGIVKRSPRCSKMARFPVGEMRASRSPVAGTSCQRGMAQVMSPATWISSRRVAPVPGVELVQIAGLLVDHHAVARPHALHLEVGVGGELLLLTGSGVPRPDVRGPVPLGEVVDHAVHPDGAHVTLPLPWGEDALEALQIHHRDGLGLASLGNCATPGPRSPLPGRPRNGRRPRGPRYPPGRWEGPWGIRPPGAP
jgi:hypothetical protein